MVAAPARAQQTGPSKEEIRHAFDVMSTGERALKAAIPDTATARASYEAVLALPETVYTVLSRIRLACVERLEQRPWEAMRLLEELQREVEAGRWQPWMTGNTQFLLETELADTFASLGLPELAVRHAMNAAAAAKRPADRLAACAADLRVRLMARDWRGVEDVATKALGDAGFAEVAAAPRLQIRLYQLLARSRIARDARELGQIASALEQLAPELAVPADARLALRQAAEAWGMAGDPAAAAGCNRQLLLDDCSTAVETAEVLAQRARLAVATGSGAEAVASHTRRLDLFVRGWLRELQTSPIREAGAGTFNSATNRDMVATLASLRATAPEADLAPAAVFDVMEAVFALGSTTRRLCGDGVAAFADLRSLVPADGGVLLQLSGPWSATYLLADAAGVELFTVPLTPSFWTDAEGYVAMVDRQPATGIAASDLLAAQRRAGERLGGRLLPPALRQRMAAWRSLVVVGDEENARLLHVLPWDESWLPLRFAVTCLPSVTLGTVLGARTVAPAAPDLDCRLLADPPIDRATAARYGIATLELGAAIRRDLVAPFEPWRIDARFDAAADLTALADGSRRARLLCVFTHGVMEVTRERSAGIVLAQGGGSVLVSADAIERLRVPPTVLLASCAAASGPRRLGDDGARHLGGAFMRAGARTVVLASGAISLGATADLVAEFLRAWRSGSSVADAMRRARASIAATPGRELPYYWAGLRVAGVDSGW